RPTCVCCRPRPACSARCSTPTPEPSFGETMPASAIDCDALREQLLAPDPMQRVMALHALEVEVARGGPRPLANEVMRFTERGIPFYALHDPHFCDWVSKAVSYWQ